jgi:hypothetical protein
MKTKWCDKKTSTTNVAMGSFTPSSRLQKMRACGCSRGNCKSEHESLCEMVFHSYAIFLRCCRLVKQSIRILAQVIIANRSTFSCLPQSHRETNFARAPGHEYWSCRSPFFEKSIDFERLHIASIHEFSQSNRKRKDQCNAIFWSLVSKTCPWASPD